MPQISLSSKLKGDIYLVKNGVRSIIRSFIIDPTLPDNEILEGGYFQSKVISILADEHFPDKDFCYIENCIIVLDNIFGVMMLDPSNCIYYQIEVMA